MNKTRMEGICTALPVCLGILPVGISYGLLAVQAGLTPAQATLMSAAVMAGASQLMVVGMLGQANIPALVIAVFFMNLRHIVMSSSVMHRLVKTSLRMRLLCAFALCDESFALFSLSGSRSAEHLLGIDLALYGAWVASSLAGCLLGRLLPVIIAKSFGVAFYAAFAAMLIPPVRKNRALMYLVLLTGALHAALRQLLPPSWSVILAMIAAAVAGTYFVEVHPDEDC